MWERQHRDRGDTLLYYYTSPVPSKLNLQWKVCQKKDRKKKKSCCCRSLCCPPVLVWCLKRQFCFENECVGGFSFGAIKYWKSIGMFFFFFQISLINTVCLTKNIFLSSRWIRFPGEMGTSSCERQQNEKRSFFILQWGFYLYPASLAQQSNSELLIMDFDLKQVCFVAVEGSRIKK